MTARIPLFCIAFLLTVHATAAAPPVAQWAREGRLDSLHAALMNDPAFARTPAGELAGALIATDAVQAYAACRRLVREATLPAELQAVAWHRLYGYGVASGDIGLANEASGWLRGHPEAAAPLFTGALPAPLAEPDIVPRVSVPDRSTRESSAGAWSLQIGAFSSRGNADALAAKQRARGYSVNVEPVNSGGKTLFAVRVGRFANEADARAFGRRNYGQEGKEFRVVRE